jgi:hypothetical protein
MLGIIPMYDKASIYSQASTKDSWGQPSQSATPTYANLKCFINYNTDLTQIYAINGVMTTMSATVIFHGLVDVRNGDWIGFETALGVIKKYQVVDVFFFRDYAGKIIATRAVIGNGSRS